MKSASIRQLLIMSIRDRTRFAGALLALFIGGAVNLVFPQIMKLALSEDSALYILKHSLELGVVLGLLFVLQGICFYFRSLLFGQLGHGAAHDSRVDLYNKLVEKPLQFFDKKHSGDIVSCLIADTQLIQNAISVRVSVLIRYALQVVGGVVLMVWLSPLLTLLILLILPLLVGVSLVLAKRLKHFTKLQQEMLGEASQSAEEMLGAMDIVKSFDAETSLSTRFAEFSERVRQLGNARTTVSAFFQSFVSFLLNICLLILFLYAVSLVERSYISMAELTAFLLYGGIVAVSFALLMGSFSDLVQATAALQRLEELKSFEAELEESKGVDKEVSVDEGIRFEGVSFAYPTRPDSRILDGVTFTLEPNKITALVGPSGAGKTAVIELLLGLYSPDEGAVLVGEKKLPNLCIQEYRGQVGYVPQGNDLFGMSILENLQLGGKSYELSAVEAVCTALNLHDFISKLPQGYNTELGQRGAQLSGGQRQRLAIARALLRSPKLLILDEATSALDSRNEQDILAAVKALGIDVTILLVTHRTSTLQMAENVLQLEDGKIKIQDRVA